MKKLLSLLAVLSAVALSASQRHPTTPPDKDKKTGLKVYEMTQLPGNKPSQR